MCAQVVAQLSKRLKSMFMLTFFLCFAGHFYLEASFEKIVSNVDYSL